MLSARRNGSAHAEANDQHDPVGSDQVEHLGRDVESTISAASPLPTSMPAAISAGTRREKMPETMRPGRAPSAARMPISRVRRATVNDISEWMPVAESSSTSEINQAMNVAAQVSVASPPPTSVSG